MTADELLAALSDEQVLALTIYGEARGEPLEGQVAVGAVIRNRLCTGRWGPTYRAVCLAKAQFSCWSAVGGAGEFSNNQVVLTQARLLVEGGVALPILRQCHFLAQGIASQALLDNTGRATHYLTRDLYVHNPPAWARKLAVTDRIGAHVFLREP
jgi:N-acetylmuramoyl-L-alanine amidase